MNNIVSLLSWGKLNYFSEISKKLLFLLNILTLQISFDFNFIIKLLTYNCSNNYFINIVNNKILYYNLIYSPKLIKSEILKNYYNIN